MRKLSFLVMSVFLAVAPIVTAEAAVLDIQTVESSNGIKAWLVEDHSVPVISFRFVFVGAGSVNDPEDKQGLSQILSNTLDEGAGDLDSKAFQGKLDDYSISLGFSSSRDDFGGSLKTLSKYQDTAFDLLQMAMTRPRFDKDPVARMVQSNLVRIRSNMTDPEWMNARLTNGVLFSGHPYAFNSGGTLSSLPRITPDDLRQKFKTQLGRDRLMVAVAGDITKESLAKILDKVFGEIPQTSRVREVTQTVWPQKTATYLYRQDIPQTVVTMALPGIRRDDKDFFAAEAMDFILGSSGFGSRLTEEIREKRGLTYGIYSNLSDMDYATLLSITASTKNESVADVIRLSQTIVDTLSRMPVTGKELQDAKTYLTGSVPLQLTSTDRISGVMLSLQRDRLPPDYLDQREISIKSLKIGDIQRVAQRLLNLHTLQIILVGNPEMGDTGVSVSQTVPQLPNVE